MIRLREPDHSVNETIAPRNTVVGLFEDMIDAEHVLLALRRADRPAEQVSVLVRDRADDSRGAPDRHGEIGRAVVASALGSVSGWLLGLAALIVPDNGTYLVAGPIGVALAGVRTIETHHRSLGEEGSGDRDDGSGMSLGSLRQILTEFGFRIDEASYLQSRLAAGSVLVAVTTSDLNQLNSIRRMFANYSAVHIGQAQTGDLIANEASELLAAPPEEVESGDVVVTDAVAPLVRLCSGSDRDLPWPSICGAKVVDVFDQDVGEVEDLLAVGSGDPDVIPEIRYIIVQFGGFFGLGRHRIAVPADQVDLRGYPVRLVVSREVLRRAPEHDPKLPFSRREEMAVNAYFGSTPYWLKR